MNEFALIIYVLHDNKVSCEVKWYATLIEAMTHRRFMLDKSTDVVIYVAYCPPALLAHGETILPIKIPGVTQ